MSFRERFVVVVPAVVTVIVVLAVDHGAKNHGLMALLGQTASHVWQFVTRLVGLA